MKKIILILLSLITFSCYQVGGLLVDEPLKFYSLEKVPIIKAKLNGNDAYFIIDSGASSSFLDINNVNEFNFNVIETDSYSAAGFAGINRTYDVENYTFQIKGYATKINFKGADLYHVISYLNKEYGIKVIGIIGSDWLKDNSIIIDYKNSELRKG